MKKIFFIIFLVCIIIANTLYAAQASTLVINGTVIIAAASVILAVSGTFNIISLFRIKLQEKDNSKEKAQQLAEEQAQTHSNADMAVPDIEEDGDR